MTGLAVLHLLKAESLPRSVEELRACTNPSVARALDLVAHVGPEAADAEALRWVAAALEAVGLPAVPVGYTAEEIATLPPDRYEEHDEFFLVVRTGGDPTARFTQTLLESYRSLLLDALASGVTLTPVEWQHLRSAFDATLAYLRRAVAAVPESSLRPLAVEVVERPTSAELRWRLGHQVFFAMIQSLIVATGCAMHALDTGDLGRASADLDLATVLMEGSAASLRFAGDFSPEDYEQRVRPAMMPPHLQPGFSGLQVRDHRYLLQRLRKLRLAVIEVGQPLRQQYERFIEAFARTYDSHKLVCARFNGDVEPSLRMSTDADIMAVEVLDRLKRGRTRSVQW
jgi:hypothetical protein